MKSNFLFLFFHIEIEKKIRQWINVDTFINSRERDKKNFVREFSRNLKSSVSPKYHPDDGATLGGALIEKWRGF